MLESKLAWQTEDIDVQNFSKFIFSLSIMIELKVEKIMNFQI